MNLRGNIVTVYDIRSIFNINTVWKSDKSSIVVLSFQNELIGIFVDHVVDIINIYNEKEIIDSDDFFQVMA